MLRRPIIWCITLKFTVSMMLYGITFGTSDTLEVKVLDVENAKYLKINPFDPKANREGKLHQVVEKIKGFFNKFFDVANGEF